MPVRRHPVKIAIRQVRGGSGADVWSETLCRGIRNSGHDCTLDLSPSWYQFAPGLVKYQNLSSDVDIVHGNSWNAFAFRQRSPLVVTEHHVIHDPLFNPYRSPDQRLYHRWIFRCEKRSFDLAETITCVSRFTQQKLEECFGIQDSHLIYNGIDTDIFHPADPETDPWNLPPGKTVLLFAGNLSRRKGGDLLPAIMKELGDDYVLLLATGQRAGGTSGSGRVINVGHLDLPGLVAAYNRCDIFLSASRLEGFGLSVVEAMACGKPVVATNGSSLPELVIDEKGGFLCRIDDVKDFAEKITMLGSDEALRHEMGLYNRRRVEENFTIEKMTKEYIKIYKSIAW
jgi:glycosyltransferase involved in cell wall biosynthesis